jgi:hypothetical protein
MSMLAEFINMKQEVSEIIGDGMTAQGASVKVYRALRTLLCERCGGQIAEGEIFTRWPIAQQLLRIMPRCLACAPFELQEQDKTPTHPPRSTLLTELLNTTRQSDETAAGSSQSDVRRDVGSDIEKRLGPALRWTRRSKK